MNVKRYDIGTFGGMSMESSSDGAYVRHDDYVALEARCAALAAENAGLKDEISNITFMRDDDFFGSTQRAQEVMGRLVNFKTPATDAFLAEVRAQGVDMLRDSIAEIEGGIEDTIDLHHYCTDFAAEIRKGVQS